ncbi:hypothetical protein MKK75_17595 [Methylobacterium sp. J-030]|uniref:hypothetical protein n=1 Tax=Methylobacterium sp. J-030 TaxID=2836627 RepID=UPI001FBC10DB|nr:hypothetical protein [Methylobacterium sp. J-030]MCJ2070586.1 hypothetical protein [Methylobacterium sp. J-030]
MMTGKIEPPKWLERHEKHEFRRIIAARAALNAPVQAAEINTLADYVQSRTRIDHLTILAEKERTRGFTKDYLAATRAVEAAIATSRRLAIDLGLMATPTS